LFYKTTNAQNRSFKHSYESSAQLIVQSNIIVNYLHENNMHDNRPRN